MANERGFHPHTSQEITLYPGQETQSECHSVSGTYACSAGVKSLRSSLLWIKRMWILNSLYRYLPHNRRIRKGKKAHRASSTVGLPMRDNEFIFAAAMSSGSGEAPLFFFFFSRTSSVCLRLSNVAAKTSLEFPGGQCCSDSIERVNFAIGLDFAEHVLL